MRTKIYTVHTKSDASADMENAEFVQEGFSFWGFLFGPLWALYHRLWLPAALLVALSALLKYAHHAQLLTQAETSVIQLGIQVIAGFMAFDWLRTRYRRKGYALVDIVASTDKLGAEQRYFDRALYQGLGARH